jgi:hypothetical protein
MSTDKERPTPPPTPKVSRETGKVSTPRFDDDVEAQGGYQGWKSSEDPFEGGVSGTRFNDAQPESERAADAAEFEKSSNSVIR